VAPIASISRSWVRSPNVTVMLSLRPLAAMASTVVWSVTLSRAAFASAW
jgi:hypothetical protein